jgi:hypothetical protein
VSFTEHLRVAGYPYDDLQFFVVAPAQVAKGPRGGYDAQEHLFKGGEVSAELKNATHTAQPHIAYAVKVDTRPAALVEARALLPKDQRDAALGIARLGRFRDGVFEADRRIALEGLDDGHLMDRLTSALLTWHGEFFGPGPDAKPAAVPRRRHSPSV